MINYTKILASIRRGREECTIYLVTRDDFFLHQDGTFLGASDYCDCEIPESGDCPCGKTFAVQKGGFVIESRKHFSDPYDGAHIWRYPIHKSDPRASRKLNEVLYENFTFYFDEKCEFKVQERGLYYNGKRIN